MGLGPHGRGRKLRGERGEHATSPPPRRCGFAAFPACGAIRSRRRRRRLRRRRGRGEIGAPRPVRSGKTRRAKRWPQPRRVFPRSRRRRRRRRGGEAAAVRRRRRRRRRPAAAGRNVEWGGRGRPRASGRRPPCRRRRPGPPLPRRGEDDRKEKWSGEGGGRRGRPPRAGRRSACAVVSPSGRTRGRRPSVARPSGRVRGRRPSVARPSGRVRGRRPSVARAFPACDPISLHGRREKVPIQRA